MKRVIKALLLFICIGCLFSILNTQVTCETPKGSFWIEYIDVGQGDSVLVQCDGHYMLIDGGPSKASSTIYTILKKSGISYLDYIIATHPDSDHIGGLSGALNYAKVGTCFCPVNDYETKTFKSLIKYLGKQNVGITYPKVNESILLGSAKVTFLGPITISDDSNNSSIVVRVEYGNTSFLFMGDAEYEEENEILHAGRDIKSDVIKLGHHGSASSTSEALINAVNPKYAIISVGKNNSYGHPTNEVLNRVSAHGIKIYRTDLNGDITIYSDGNKVDILCEKKSVEEIPTVTKTVPTGITYVINTNTKRFHYPDCSSVQQMKEKNKEYSTKTAEEIKNMGYKPCGNCKPYN